MQTHTFRTWLAVWLGVIAGAAVAHAQPGITHHSNQNDEYEPLIADTQIFIEQIDHVVPDSDDPPDPIDPPGWQGHLLLTGRPDDGALPGTDPGPLPQGPVDQPWLRPQLFDPLDRAFGSPSYGPTAGPTITPEPASALALLLGLAVAMPAGRRSRRR